MSKPRLVLIGNGMAGVRTVEELLKIKPDHYDITIFGAEPDPNYNRILLSPVLAGEMTRGRPRVKRRRSSSSSPSLSRSTPENTRKRGNAN